MRSIQIPGKMRTNKYTKNEIEYVLNAVSDGKTYGDIGDELQKPDYVIKEILLTIICDRIDKGLGLETFYCNEYGVTPEMLSDFRKSLV
jgi:hypothetical protein